MGTSGTRAEPDGATGADAPGSGERAVDGERAADAPADRPTTVAVGEPAAVRPVARPRRRRTVARVLALVAVVLLLLGAWLASRVWQAVTALQDARDLLGGVALETSVDAALDPALADDLADARAATSRAAAASTDPVWRAAEHLPWAGEQLAAVRVVADALDAVAGEVLPAVEDLRDLLGGAVRGPDGRVDVEALVPVVARVEQAAATASGAHADVAALDPDRLVGPLAGPVRTTQDALAGVDAALGPAGRTAGVLPAMLGVDGPRTYLVLALNTAELRAAGGIVGTLVAVRVEDGRVTLADRRTTRGLAGAGRLVLPLTAEESALWGDDLGRWAQNAVSTPDFPRTAELVVAHWARAGGGPVDGVLATDPVAVAGLVGATGPVPDPDGGDLGADRLATALLRDAYVAHPEPADSDDYFGAVVAGILDAVGAGAGDPRDLLAAGRDAVDERRLRVWSAHPDEQERLVATVAGGAFTSGPFADQPGIFLDDATQAKLGAYLTTGVTFRDARCTGPDPAVTAVLRLDYRPPVGIEGFPRYVTGTPGPDVPLGTLLTAVSVWSAQDGPPLVVTRDGAPATGSAAAADGRRVQRIASQLAPGQVQELAVDVPLRDGAVTLWTTPTLTQPGVATYRCG